MPVLPACINTITSSDLVFLYLHTSGEGHICPSANQKLRDNALQLIFFICATHCKLEKNACKNIK